MSPYIILTIASVVTMPILDTIWLSTMSKSFYSPHIGHLMAASPSFPPAIIFYILYTIALTVFVTYPAYTNSTTILNVFLLGAFFGLVAYATYDLTNQATLKDWPVIVTIVDVAWGAMVTGVVSVVSISVARFFA